MGRWSFALYPDAAEGGGSFRSVAGSSGDGRSLDPLDSSEDGAKRAKRMGLVDQAVPLRILENTARMVTLEAPAQRKPSLVNRLMAGPLKGVVVSQARKQVAKKARREHYPAPYAILELWKKYDGNPFAAANDPSASVGSLFAHPTTANLIRIFFLQERL